MTNQAIAVRQSVGRNAPAPQNTGGKLGGEEVQRLEIDDLWHRWRAVKSHGGIPGVIRGFPRLRRAGFKMPPLMKRGPDSRDEPPAADLRDSYTGSCSIRHFTGQTAFRLWLPLVVILHHVCF
jgi:hypothetical protein